MGEVRDINFLVSHAFHVQSHCFLQILLQIHICSPTQGMAIITVSGVCAFQEDVVQERECATIR